MVNTADKRDDKRKRKRRFWERHFRLSRMRHNSRAQRGEKSVTVSKTIKEMFRDLKWDRSLVDEHHTLKRWRNKEAQAKKLVSERNASFNSSEVTSKQLELSSVSDASNFKLNQLDFPASSSPLVLPYREEASLESIYYKPLNTQHLPISVSRSAPAPPKQSSSGLGGSDWQRESIQRETLRRISDSLILPGTAPLQTDHFRSRKIIESYSRSAVDTPIYDSDPVMRPTTIDISSTPNTRAAASDSGTNSVMKRLESSFLSLFGFSSTKNLSSCEAAAPSMSDENSKGNFLFQCRHPRKKKHPQTPPHSSSTSREYIDYSIYGNHAKYFI